MWLNELRPQNSNADPDDDGLQESRRSAMSPKFNDPSDLTEARKTANSVVSRAQKGEVFDILVEPFPEETAVTQDEENREGPARVADASLAQLLLDAGAAFADRGQWSSALQSAEQVLGLITSESQVEIRSQALSLLAKARVQTEDGPGAESAWLELIQTLEAAADHRAMARTWIDIGMARRKRDELEGAHDAFTESLRCSASSTPHLERAEALEQLGVVERLRGDSLSSRRRLEEALRIYEALEELAPLVRTLEKLGNVKQRMGDVDGAEADYLRALTLLEDQEDQGRTAALHNNLGGLKHKVGDRDAAIAYFRKAHDLFQKRGDRLQVAVTLGNLGALHSLRGETSHAEESLKNGLKILDELGEKRPRPSLLTNLSMVCYMAGRFADALRWADASIAAREEIGKEEGATKSLVNRARALIGLGRTNEAEAVIADAADVARRRGGPEDECEALLMRALLELERGQSNEAILTARDAASLAGTAYPRQRAEALRLEARAHAKLGDDDRVRDLLLESESSFARLSDPYHRALCGLDLGRVFLRVNAEEAAATHFRSARSLFLLLENDPLSVEAGLGLAESLWALDPAESRAVLQEMRRHAQARGRDEDLEQTRRLEQRLEARSRDSFEPVSLLRGLSSRLRAGHDADAIGNYLRDGLGAKWLRIRFHEGPAWYQSGVLDTVLPTVEGRAARRSVLADGSHYLFAPIPGKKDGVFECVFQDRPTSESVAEACADLLALAATSESIAAATNVPSSRVEVQQFEGMVYASRQMQGIISTIERVAVTDASVLIRGESGTGKELVAQALHEKSARKGAFVAINCPSFPKDLIEAELFGHEKGAFTGAERARPGQIESADGGTLFLDEIGDMEMTVQTKLLRFLEQREFLRVGGRDPVRVDVRLVAATSRDLESMVEDGTFRRDLLHRIMVVPIHLPALRDRREDIPALIYFFAAERSANEGSERTFDEEAVLCLQRYAWPGNIREMRNLVHRVFATSGDATLGLSAIPAEYRIPMGSESTKEGTSVWISEAEPLRPGETLAARMMSVEGSLLRRMLEETGWNQSQAARRLGIKESTIRDKIRKYGIRRPGTSKTSSSERRRAES